MWTRWARNAAALTVEPTPTSGLGTEAWPLAPLVPRNGHGGLGEAGRHAPGTKSSGGRWHDALLGVWQRSSRARTHGGWRLAVRRLRPEGKRRDAAGHGSGPGAAMISFHGPGPAGPKCDACFTREPSWFHPTCVFAVPGLLGDVMVLGAQGGLAACTECSTDLDAGHLDALSKRALESLGSLGEIHRARLLPHLHRLHHAMHNNRNGTRRPYP